VANIEVTDELKEFFIEAFEMLEESENIFLQVGKGKDFKTIYSAVFRTFHSLKGAAGMFELAELQHHMHQLENILTECQPRNVFTQGEVTFFLKGIDAAKKIINGEHVKFDYAVTEENAAPKAAPAPAAAPTSAPAVEVKAPSHAPSTAPITMTKTASRPLEYQGEIVVVDDEEEIGYIIERFLQGTNFRVRRFTDPVAAIESIKEKHPDAVFTDMNMPVKSGMDVLRATKATNPDIPEWSLLRDRETFR
jgi:chemotaxis protein histidine kinase CheA